MLEPAAQTTRDGLASWMGVRDDIVDLGVRIARAAGGPRVLRAALHMALVLLAALVAVPVDRLPDDADLVATMAGTAIGLVLAHWLAFRLAAHLTAEGGFGAASAAREAGAQITGGLAVALVASVPFLVLDGEDALSFTLVLLAALPALTGLAIARLRGRSWVESVITAGIVFGIAVLVVVVKVTLGH